MSDYLDPYRDAVEQLGASFEALLWRSREYQLVRFRVLIETAAAGLAPAEPGLSTGALANRVIADLGCGRGDLLTWLESHDVPFGRYLGIEAIPELAAATRERTAGTAHADVIEVDFAGDEDLFESLVRAHGATVFLFSGSLNTFAQDEAERVIARACRALESVPSGAVVFNFLSSYSPSAHLADTGPAVRFDTARAIAFASGLSRSFAVRHDYLRGHDATIGVFTSSDRV